MVILELAGVLIKSLEEKEHFVSPLAFLASAQLAKCA